MQGAINGMILSEPRLLQLDPLRVRARVDAMLFGLYIPRKQVRLRVTLGLGVPKGQGQGGRNALWPYIPRKQVCAKLAPRDSLE